jgi:hypothetical protein
VGHNEFSAKIYLMSTDSMEMGATKNGNASGSGSNRSSGTNE